MSEVTPIKKQLEIDLANYFNSITGASLLDELDEDTSISIKQDSGQSMINYKDYSVIETEAFLILSQILNKSDLANVLMMALTVKTPLSVLFNNTVPHSNETLQNYLKIKSESMYMALIKRLINNGILYKITGLINKEVRVIYMINPYICKKRKTFETKVLAVFKQFKKDTIKSSTEE